MRARQHRQDRVGACILATIVLAVTAPALASERVRAVPRTAAVSPAGDSVVLPAVAQPARTIVGALSVVIDRAKVIRLPERTSTVIIGNPAIADIAVQKNGIVVVTGKSYGSTNMIALDAGGNMLAESMVAVNAPTDGIVTLQKGGDRQTLSCTPNCQPSILLGDANSFFTENKGQAEQRNLFATQR
jgi:hypothetical protein